MAGSASAQSLWTNTGTGDWTVGGNWSAGVPTSLIGATIQNGGAATLANTAETLELIVGTATGNGTLSITDGSLAVGGHSFLGYSGTGSASISGGTWSSGGQLLVGIYGNASLAISGGNVSAGESYIGYGGTGTATVSDGTWSTAGNLYIGVDPGLAATGTLTVNGGAVSANAVYFAYDLGATGNLNLNGGTLSTKLVSESTGTGGAHINFNGGTLRALASQATFFQNLEAGDVQFLAGGATIDTNNYNIGISTVLQGAGGLTKIGAGKLTLGGISTYTGATVVDAGTIHLTYYDNISSSASITVNTGGTLTAQDSIVIGNAASGVESLALSGGAMTITGTSYIGYFNEASATVTGGTWNTGDLLVGYAGNGSLSISSGVVTATNSSYVGFSGTSTATISGGTWNTTGYLWIGVDAGTPTIGTVNMNGGAVSAEIVQMAYEGNSTGNLNLNGGILSTHAIIEQNGSGGGHVNLNGGTLRALANVDFLQGFETGDVQILAGGATIDTNTHDISISTVMQGAGGLNKIGAGELTLDGANTYTGATVVDAGTLHLTNSTNIGNSSLVTVNTGGTLTAASGLKIGSTATGTESLAIAGGTVSVTGDLFVGDAGNGSASITSGSLAVSGGSYLGYPGSTGNVTVSGGTWSTTGYSVVGYQGNATLTINAGDVSVGAYSYIGFSGTATTTVNGGTWTNASTLWIGEDYGAAASGSLRIDGGAVSADNIVLANSGTSTGSISIGGGVLSTKYISESNGSGGGYLSFNTGTLRAMENQANFLQNFETHDVQIGAGGATFDSQAFNVGIETSLQGRGGLTKIGSGILTLTGNNGYTGATNVNDGTLKVSGSISTSVLTTVNNGAILTGTGSVGNLVIANGGTLSPGNSPGTLDAGNTTFSGGGDYLWEINNVAGTVGANPGWDHLDIVGGLSITATVGNPFVIDITSLTLANAAGDANGFDPGEIYSFMIVTTTGGITGFQANKFTILTDNFSNDFTESWSISSNGSSLFLNYNAIPEPSIASLVGLIGCFMILRRRR